MKHEMNGEIHSNAPSMRTKSVCYVLKDIQNFMEEK